jgi:hypothetical protein
MIDHAMVDGLLIGWAYMLLPAYGGVAAHGAEGIQHVPSVHEHEPIVADECYAEAICG